MSERKVDLALIIVFLALSHFCVFVIHRDNSSMAMLRISKSQCSCCSALVVHHEGSFSYGFASWLAVNTFSN